MVKLVFYDLETLGLVPFLHEMTEIGAITSTNDMFSQLLKIEGNVSEFIENLTGINDTLLQNEGIDLKEGLVNFYSFLTRNLGDDKVVLIAHNGDGFDKLFIKYNYLKVFTKENDPLFDNENVRYFDTKLMAKFLYPDISPKETSLANLARRFDVPNENHHRALNDAIVCREIFNKMFEESSYNNFEDMYESMYGCKF